MADTTEATDATEANDTTEGAESAEGTTTKANQAAEGTPSKADQAAEGTPSKAERLEREGDIAADYLEGVLDIADLDGDIDMDVEGDRAVVALVGDDVDVLVGQDGEVLDALQELTRLAVLRETGERSRLMLDVAGHRAARKAHLTELGAEAVERVKSSGESVALEPMNPFERKVVHDVVAESGLRSESEGTEPRRYVVILPA